MVESELQRLTMACSLLAAVVAVLLSIKARKCRDLERVGPEQCKMVRPRHDRVPCSRVLIQTSTAALIVLVVVEGLLTTCANWTSRTDRHRSAFALGLCELVTAAT